ncbi:uncharacterized protein LOC143820940 isoform X1 [Paroedura picta]|uniref:uncharacterized protein LOC143820940 isoform X1 n=1 Tax=Paroedura picta TaxID=143630 RepID=UPI004057175B
MGSGLLWAVAAALAVAALPGPGQAAELREAAWETKGEPPKGDLGTPQLYSTTTHLRRPRNKTRNFRTGSFSILSRKSAVNLNLLLDGDKGNASHPKRDAISNHDPCLGCCGTAWPGHPGSSESQPSVGDSGPAATTAVPRRNGTWGSPHPGAYTPMRRMQMTGSLSGTISARPKEDNPTPDRCYGCCGVTTTGSANSPGRREMGHGSSKKPASGGSSSKGAWRPVLDSKDPNQHPSQTEGDEGWPASPRGAVPPWHNHAGQ